MAGIMDLANSQAQAGGWLTPEQIEILRNLQIRASGRDRSYRPITDEDYAWSVDPETGNSYRVAPSNAVARYVADSGDSGGGGTYYEIPVGEERDIYDLNSIDWEALKAHGLQSKYNQVEQMPDGTLKVTLQRPGMHKYDTMDIFYRTDPNTGKFIPVGGMPTRQVSSRENFRDAVEEGGGIIGGAVLAGTGMLNPSMFGSGALGSAASGAAVGGGLAAAQGGGWDEFLRGAAIGGLTAGVGDYLMGSGEIGSLGPSAGSTSAAGGVSGSTGAEGMSSFYGPPGSSGAATGAGSVAGTTGGASNYDALADFFRTGTTDYGAGSIYSGGIPSMLDYTADPTIANFDPNTLPVDLTGGSYLTNPYMSASPGLEFSNINTPSTTGFDTPTLDVSPSAPATQSPGNQIADWIRNNPIDAANIGLGLVGSAVGGGGGGSGSVGIGGADQSGLTAQQAPAFRRQYVAPLAGYRPGFDPEHKFFTGIGTVGTGPG